MQKNGRYGVSIIIPCYNDQRYLPEALESLNLQGTKAPFEVLIVDDGSEDPNTQADIQNCVKKYPNMDIKILIHQRNMGVSSARNTGLENARYDYIFPFDVDNKLSSDPKVLKNGGYIDRALEILRTKPEVLFVHCRGEYFEGMSGPCRIKPFSEEGMLFENSLDARAVYRRKEALDVGGYNERIPFAEDWDFAVAMINRRNLNGQPYVVIDIGEPLFLYRIRKDRSNLSSKERDGRALLIHVLHRSREIYKKHFPHVNEHELPEFITKKQARKWYFNHIAKTLMQSLDPREWPSLCVKISRKFKHASHPDLQERHKTQAMPSEFEYRQ